MCMCVSVPAYAYMCVFPGKTEGNRAKVVQRLFFM